MADRIASATVLVREVADASLSHGERTFAIGLALLSLTGVGFVAASVLRIYGLV